MGMTTMTTLMATTRTMTTTRRVSQTTSSFPLEVEGGGEVEQEHQVLCQDVQQQLQKEAVRQLGRAWGWISGEDEAKAVAGGGGVTTQAVKTPAPPSPIKKVKRSRKTLNSSMASKSAADSTLGCSHSSGKRSISTA